jgi:hypothetical protein
MPSAPSRPSAASLSSEELAWVGAIADRYDALVFHWVGPLTGSYFFLMPRSLWDHRTARRPIERPRARPVRRRSASE